MRAATDKVKEAAASTLKDWEWDRGGKQLRDGRDALDHAKQSLRYSTEAVARTTKWRAEFPDGKHYQGRAEQAEELAKEAEAHVATCRATVATLEATVAALKRPQVRATTSAAFERCGIDVVINWHVFVDIDGEEHHTARGDALHVELKPMLGDDYPTAMRQMQRLGVDTLVVGTYHGTAVSADQLQQMFAANGCNFVFAQEIEKEMERMTKERARL